MSEPVETAVPLGTLQPGDRARIIAFDLPGGTRSRILEMGVTAGVTVEVVRFAPMGDPMEIKVRGSHLSLRKADALGIRVQRL